MGTPEWSDDRTEGQRRWGRVALIATAAIVLFGIGALVGRGLAPEAEADNASPPGQRDIGPTDVLDGVAVGYGRSEEGALAAAANFTAAQAACAEDLEECLQVMRTIASPQWQEEAERQARNGIRFVSERFGGNATVSTGLLRYRITSFTGDNASIDFWAVTVLRGNKRPAGESVWGILHVDLTWVDGDWRVSGQDTTSGPFPRTLRSPEDAQALESVIATFRRYGNVGPP